jgi:adenosylcobinamide-phosphate synthase
MDQIIIYAILLAYLLDLLIGDPIALPHPVVGFGKLIALGEKRLNVGSHRLLMGLVLSVGLIVLVWDLFFAMMHLAGLLSAWLEAALVFVFFFYGIANRTLIREGKMVFSVLNNLGVEAGRKQLSRIVGRDTSQLTPQQIRTAVLETMAENLSDGVVAPIFWFIVGGIPAMMAYKMVNTLDSMIGYKSDRYLLFGRVAARIDDVANFIPARLTALLMCLVTFSVRALVFIFKFGRLHSSPNSGYPEAAMAGILNVRFGGSNVYHGQRVDKPFIGSNNREITHRDFYTAAYVNHAVCVVMVIISIICVSCWVR